MLWENHLKMLFKSHRKRKNTLLAALALLPGGVVTTAKTVRAQEIQPQRAAILPYETVGLGSQSGCAKRALMFITDEPEWRRVWGVHSQGTVDASKLPRVDFSKQSVIALLAGTLPTAKSIQVAQIVRDAREAVVFYLVADEETAWGKQAASGPSQPFHFAVIDKLDTPVRFVDALIGDVNCRKCAGG